MARNRGSADAPAIGARMKGKNDLQPATPKQNIPAPAALKGSKVRGSIK